MFKKAIKIAFLALVLFLASKAYIAFTVYQSLADFKERHKDLFLLTYEWISTDLDGTLSIKNMQLTPYTLKRTFDIERLDIQYASYPVLLTSISSLFQGDVQGIDSVQIPELTTELKGRSFQEFFADQASDLWLKPFSVYGCGSQQNLTDAQYQAIGIQEFRAALKLDISRNSAAEEALMLSVDLHELGRFQLNIQLSDSSFTRGVKTQDFSGLSFREAEFTHQEAGFFRRLNVLCNPVESKERLVFSMLSAEAWQNALQARGLMPNQALAQAYQAYLLKGGELSLDLTPEKPFSFSAISSLLDKELFAFFNAALRLNGARLPGTELYVDQQTIYPPPPKPVEKVASRTEPKWEPGYRVTALEELVQYVGQKVRVTMRDQKSYEGILGEVTEYNMDVIQNLPGGRVNYPLMLNEIDTVEVWFNARP